MWQKKNPRPVDKDTETPAKKKQKVKEPEASEDEEEDNTWTINKKPLRKVEVKPFRGKLYVNIREFYEDANGEIKPSKKGISLTVDQWKALQSVAADIDELVAKG